MLLLRSTSLAGAALLRPMVPLTPSILPRLLEMPILVCAGQHDPIATAENTSCLIALFQRCGAHVQQSWSIGGHELAEIDLQTSSHWLREVNRTGSSAGIRPAE